ncbi:hypothetical protein GCM10025734_39270 [Kitasatospora paranensis]
MGVGSAKGAGMAAIGWVMLAVLAGGAGLGWRLHRYPGGRECAFGTEYAALRDDLTAARRRVRTEVRTENRERTEADAQVRGREAEYRQRVAAAEAELAELRDPGPGRELDTLGTVVLHERVLIAGRQQFPLAGIDVSVRGYGGGWRLRLRPPRGRATEVTFSRKDFDEDDVRRFADRITDTVPHAERHAEVHPGRVADGEVRLDRIRADTTAVARARAEAERIRTRHRAEDRAALAREELEAVRKRWKAVTGHLPPR